MCEMLAVGAGETGTPFALGDILPLAVQIERYGIGGFGWGVAWHDPLTGQVKRYIDAGALRDDQAAITTLGSTRADAAIIHLRRPVQLSTIGLADTQPFYSERHGCAFAHNGDFDFHETLRPRYVERGLLQGKADSEIGFRLFEDTLDQLAGERGAAQALKQVHATLGGRANLLALLADGSISAFTHYQENWLFSCLLGSWNVVVTGLYSWDHSVFDLILRDAQAIRRLESDELLTLRPGRQEPGGERAGKRGTLLA